MKYIRTKEQILKVNVTKLSEPIYVEERKCNMIGYWGYRINDNAYVIGEIKESDFVKCSNTVPELCDELIIKNPNNDGEFYRKVFVYQGMWKNILNERHAKHCTNRDIYEHDVEIFGAIWVIDSNGVPTLKPVAKMNEKGDLCLI